MAGSPRFGTDGLRGVANADLTPEVVMALGRAAVRVLGGERFIVGRDTRLSGPMLQAALSAGLMAEGAAVDDLGVIPTPGVAWVSAQDQVPAAVISASHNPFGDNGVKFFGPGGLKLSDKAEARVEDELERVLAEPVSGARATHQSGTSGARAAHQSGTSGARAARVTGPDLGRARSHPDRDGYARALVAQLGEGALDGLSIVLDCAHGATSSVAPGVLGDLGAAVTVINDAPDGTNINDGCGSSHPEGLALEVRSRGADAGLAFDGDGDRVLAVDHTGAVVDGDHVIAICAVDRQARGLLADDTVVITVMANLGLRRALAANGIRAVETRVGDRYVLEELDAGGWSLGGEQSGHIIFRDLAPTGDGILTGLQVLDVVKRSGRPLADLARVMHRYPQVLRNVNVADRNALEDAAELWAEVSAVQERLGDTGRVLVRPSGTEQLVRVMVEAVSVEDAEAACDSLCAAVSRALGTG